jgi:hypothetical protein
VSWHLDQLDNRSLSYTRTILANTPSTDSQTPTLGSCNDNPAALEVFVAPAAAAVPEAPEPPEVPEVPAAVALTAVFFHGDAVTVYVTLDCDQVNTDPLAGAVSAFTAPVLYSVCVPFGGRLFGL